RAVLPARLIPASSRHPDCRMTARRATSRPIDPVPPAGAQDYPWRVRLQLLLPLLLLVLLTGCQHRPMRVAMQGDMQMQGELTSRMPTENRASRLVPRTVSGNGQSSSRVALIDVDG